jgi:hypothetical protein
MYSKDVGNVFGTHKWLFQVSCDPEKVMVAADFSGFDSTLKWNNFRRFVEEEIVAALEAKYGDNSPIGAWSSPAVMISELYARVRNAVFAHPSVIKGGMRTFTMDQVNSGELGTAMLDSLANLANFDYTWSEIQKDAKLRTAFKRVIKKLIMGDDAVWVLLMGRTPSKEDWQRLTAIMTDAALKSGLKLNGAKSQIRTNWGMFLQKNVGYGQYVPHLWRLLLLQNETNTFQMLPMEKFRAWYTMILEMIARGLPTEIARLLIFIRMTSLTDVKFLVPERLYDAKSISKLIGSGLEIESRGVKGKIRLAVRMSADIMFVPQVFGGGGVLPDNMISASRDSVIAYRLEEGSSLRKSVNRLSAQLKQFYRRGVKFQRLSINDIPAVKEGLKLFNLDKTRIEASRAAFTYLARRGFGDDSILYERYPRRMVEERLAENALLTDLVSDERLEFGMALISEPDSVPDLLEYTEFSWVKHITITREKPLGAYHPNGLCPVRTLDPKLQNVGGRYGMNSTGSAGLRNLNRALAALRNDPYFPQDWLRGRKLINLLQNPFFSSNSDNLLHLLLAMGASQSSASTTVAQLGDSVSKVAFDTTVRHFSSSDLFVAMIASDSEHMARVITVNPTMTGIQDIKDLYRDFAFAVSLSYPLHHTLYTYSVTSSAQAEIELLAKRYKRFISPTEIARTLGRAPSDELTWG